MSDPNKINRSYPHAHRKPLCTVSVWALLLVPLWVQAAPSGTPAAATAQTLSSASDPAADDSTDTNGTDAANSAETDATLPRTLAATYTPKIDALTQQNQALLADNLALQQRVDGLQTQVDVLIYERQGQLFLYGAATVLVSMLIGAGIARLFWRRTSRW